MIAALGMYDRAELTATTDRYWALIRDHLRADGIAAPDGLTRDARAWWDGWQSPDLLLSQTCGFPYRARLHGQVTLIGTPDYGIEGCPPGHYYSVFIARRDDPRSGLAAFAQTGFAFNEDLSQSGWAAAANHMAALGLPLTPVLRSGGHVLSAQAVAAGRADWAALDAVTWRLLCAHDPALATQLRVIGHSAPTPGLPYITARSRDPAPLFTAVQAAIAALQPEDRAALGLRGLVAIPPDAYLAIPIPPAPVLAAD